MLRMTHPSVSFFVLCLCMFVWLRVQGFESSVNRVFQEEDNRYSVLNKGISSAGTNLVHKLQKYVLQH